MLLWILNLHFAASGVEEEIVVFSVLSIINEAGAGVLSTMTINGQGVNSSIDPSEGLLSIIQSDGRGVLSLMTSDGKGVNSTITSVQT